MPQTSFAERLQRIENAQESPAKDRILVGVSEEIEASAKAPDQAGSAPARRSQALPLRFVAGFALMFTTFYSLSQMNLVDAHLAGIDGVTPYLPAFRAGVGVTVVAIMLFFAFKLQRAAFRAMTEPARLPFAIGMVAGLALGMGPTEFAGDLMAQLPIAQP